MRIMAWVAALAVVSTTALAEGDAVPATESTPGDVASDFSYTMGYSMGGRIKADLGTLDGDAFVEGFRSALAGDAARLDESRMQEVVAAFQAQRMAEAQAERQQLAARNAADGKAFMDKNRKRKGVKTLASGLQYEVLKKGAGASPQLDDMVFANYRGTLPDGTEFDASGDEPVSFPLARVIRGWQEGVALMNKGAKYRLYVPADLAYGEQGAGEVIGPNQALVFDVELVDFTPAPQQLSPDDE